MWSAICVLVLQDQKGTGLLLLGMGGVLPSSETWAEPDFFQCNRQIKQKAGSAPKLIRMGVRC